MRSEIRSLVNEDVEDFFSDTEIDSWLQLGAKHVSAIALYNCTRLTIDVPNANMDANLNQFPDGKLSGTPRVLIVSSGGADVYLKVYPTYSGTDGEPDPDAYRTYNDAAVSGDRRHVGFEYGGQFFWTGGNLNMTPAAGMTADIVCTEPYVRIPSMSISGTPYVFGIMSGGSRYYFKAYLAGSAVATPGVTVIDPGIQFLKMRAVYIGMKTTGIGAMLATEAGDSILMEDGSPLTSEGDEWLYSRVRALLGVHHTMIGHLIEASEYPIYYAYWQNKVWIWPSGSRSYSVLLYPARLVTAAEELPYHLQIPCISFAMGMAQIKDERFPAAIDALIKSRAEAYYLRETLHVNDLESIRMIRMM